MNRPPYIEPHNMKLLGFDLITDANGYLKYENDGTKHYNKDYNPNYPEPKGKVIIYINTTYAKDKFYLSIKQDGDTRTSYGGVCTSEEFLIQLLNNIR